MYRKIFPILVFFSSCVILVSCYVTRAFHYRNFNLKSLDEFAATDLPPSAAPFHFIEPAAPPIPALKAYLDTNLEHSETYAFLVIRNDSILYEKYFNQLQPSQKFPSFSVAKSFVSTLVGMAYEEGKIGSLQDPVTKYIPELGKRDKRFDNITVQHLLDMRSGVKSNESYTNPYSDVLKLGFTKNIRPRALSVKYGKGPGEFEYRSVNTQLLGMTVESATGKKLQDYMKEKLWLPLGMEYDAGWNIDNEKHNTVRAFCCINAAARDFAKLGRLFLHKGNWEGRQLISESWVDHSTDVDTFNVYGGYKNQWWSNKFYKVFPDSSSAVDFSKNFGAYSWMKGFNGNNGQRLFSVGYRDGAYHADGLLEQYIFVYPAKNLVIVRLGHNWSHPKMKGLQFVYSLGQNL